MEYDLEFLRVIFSNIYDDLEIDDDDVAATADNDRPYSGSLSHNRVFSLSWHGYESYYQELISELLKIPYIQEHWSLDGIREHVRKVIENLAEVKSEKKQVNLDFFIGGLLQELKKHYSENFIHLNILFQSTV